MKKSLGRSEENIQIIPNVRCLYSRSIYEILSYFVVYIQIFKIHQ